MSYFTCQAAAALAAPLVLLAAAGTAQAGPGHNLFEEVQWQGQHTVTITVADLMCEPCDKEIGRHLADVPGVQRVKLNRSDMTISVLPSTGRTLDTAKVEGVVRTGGYEVTAVKVGQ